MQCAEAKNLIALLVGDDIGDGERPKIQQHLSVCDGCQRYRDEIQESQRQLLTLATCADTDSPGLWVEVQSKVRVAEEAQPAKRSNKWTVALCTAALVMAVIGISKDLVFPTFDDSTTGVGTTVTWPTPQPEQPPEAELKASDKKPRQQNRPLDSIR